MDRERRTHGGGRAHRSRVRHTQLHVAGIAFGRNAEHHWPGLTTRGPCAGCACLGKHRTHAVRALFCEPGCGLPRDRFAGSDERRPECGVPRHSSQHRVLPGPQLTAPEPNAQAQHPGPAGTGRVRRRRQRIQPAARPTLLRGRKRHDPGLSLSVDRSRVSGR